MTAPGPGGVAAPQARSGAHRSIEEKPSERRDTTARGALPLVRVALLGLGLAIGLVVLVGRLFWIQVLQHDVFQNLARDQQKHRKQLVAYRGDILDRYGRTLVHTLWDHSLSANPRYVREPKRVAAVLADALGRSATELERSLRRKGGAFDLEFHLSQEEAAAVRDLELEGIVVHAPGRRVKLVRGFDLLGALNHEGVGIEGIERAMEHDLAGRDGWEVIDRDALGKELPVPGSRLRQDPLHGNHVVLTIDSQLQWLVETSLATAVKDRRASAGTAVLVDVWTGEVLALAAAGGTPPAGRRVPRLRAVEDLFEPGSTFKLVPFAAALDLGLIDDDAIFYAEQGRADFGGFVIRDVKPMGWLCVADVFARSSNIATAKIGEMVGARDLYAYARAFGFGQRTGIEVPGEQRGILRKVRNWSGRSAATVAIGQEVSVSALQLAMAYAAVANGGELLRPRLVSEVQRADGKLLRTMAPEVVRRVMEPATAAALRAYARRAVVRGTGVRADPGSISVAGKTGTAQKANEHGPGYASDKYVACFAGFFPAESPQLALVVVIDEPADGYYGGEVAAPVFAAIARETAAIAAGSGGAVEPPEMKTVAAEQVAVPDVRFLSMGAAVTELNNCGLNPTVRTAGLRVIAQEPPAGARVARGSTVEIHCRRAAPDEVPDVTGMTLREALRELRPLGLRVQARGKGGVVVEQEPDGGSPATRVTECTLELVERR